MNNHSYINVFLIFNVYVNIIFFIRENKKIIFYLFLDFFIYKILILGVFKLYNLN